MAKNLFGISTSTTKLKRETILEVSSRIISLLSSLSKVDSVFNQPYFVGKHDNDLYPIEVNYENASKTHLAELILK